MPIRYSSSSSSSTANNATNKLSTAASKSNKEGVAGVAGKVFFSSLCIITFTLGIWQTKRYNEKVSMVQKREHDLRLDPISNYHDWQKQLLKQQQQQQNEKNKNNENVNVHNEKSYRRVQLTGRYIHTKQILIGPRGPPPGALSESGPNSGRGGGGGGMASSIQGYWVITPFVIVNDDDAGTTQDSGDGNVDDIDRTRNTKRGWFGRLLWGNNNNDKKSETSTTAQQQKQQSMNTITNNKQEETIVWINRGWIPHHYINTKNNNEIIKSWNEPTNIVQLMTMESNTETPGMFSPPSRIDYTTTTKERNNEQPSRTINKLLWMDRTVMEELLCTTATDLSSSSSCINENHPPFFVEINAINDDEKTQQQQLQYPVKPTQEYVGEFKVTPEVHAGYAVTWFGLSGAGIVMTRKLLTRGR